MGALLKNFAAGANLNSSALIFKYVNMIDLTEPPACNYGHPSRTQDACQNNTKHHSQSQIDTLP